MDIIGYHDWQLRPKWICHHFHWSILLSVATGAHRLAYEIRIRSQYFTVLHHLARGKKKKESHHEKNNCYAGTWPWQWLFRSMSAACVLMRLNWNWGPMVSLIPHGCVPNYAKLLALAYLVLSITIWRKPACNDSLLLAAGFNAMKISLYPHCNHIYDTFVLSVLQRGAKHAYAMQQLYIWTQNPPAWVLVHVSLWQHGKVGLRAEMGLHPFSLLLRSDLYVVSLHRAITDRLPCSIAWRASRISWADGNAAIVNWCATSCRLPGQHPSDVLMIWHTWSNAPFVNWCAFCFSWAPTRISIDLVGLHSHSWWMQISSVKMRRKR